LSDYDIAVQAWLGGGNAPAAEGQAMPESFRMQWSTARRSPEHIAAVDRVRAWTRERFALPDDATLMVSEVRCMLPGCPPLETVGVFWTDPERRHHLKVFKPVAEVELSDLPPAWMKDALIASDGMDCNCC